MRTFGVLVLALAVGTGMSLTAAPAAAAAKKTRGGGGDGAAPTAKSDEINKLKAIRLGDPKQGTFKWNMRAEEVMAQVKAAIDKKYKDRIEGSAQDPGKQQRIKDEKDKEVNAVKKSFTKFEGQKTGWDVSIIGPEFQQNTGEAVLLAKEEIWTRYFFFFEDGLYKMFLAFNKDAIGGKSFQDFGKEMEAKYGRSKAVYREEKMKGGVRRILDHFEWNAGADKLKLIDRSEFYGVYCLVLYDAGTQERVIAKRKIMNPEQSKRDALVEAVTAKDENTRDANDNIVDRLTGKEIKKPGEGDKGANIMVPSPSSASSGPSEASKPPAPEKEGKKGKGKKSSSPLEGLEL